MQVTHICGRVNVWGEFRCECTPDGKLKFSHDKDETFSLEVNIAAAMSAHRSFITDDSFDTHPLSFGTRNIIPSLENVAAGRASPYPLSANDIAILPSMIRGKLHDPVGDGVFTGKLGEDGRLRIDHTEAHAFWLEADVTM